MYLSVSSKELNIEWSTVMLLSLSCGFFRKNIRGTNTLAYFCWASATDKKVFQRRTSPRSGTSSSSSTPAPTNVKKSVDEKQVTPKASPTDGPVPVMPPLKAVGLGAPPFGLPGFPGMRAWSRTGWNQFWSWPGNTKGGSILFDWFGLVCFANKNKKCQLSYS